MANRILIVEDETDLSRTLDYSLKKEGYETFCAATGEEALVLARMEPPPDLVLLDLMLPDIPGLEVCRRIRAHPPTHDVSVLILTAKGEEIDRVVGFEVGADDYVVKPFSVRELKLRIGAILRRQKASRFIERNSPNQTPTPLNRITQSIQIAGQEISLTSLEFRILDALVASPGEFMSRDDLLKRVWGEKSDVRSRTVDVHVNRLREKLGVANQLIETRRNVGYRYNPPKTDFSE
ncbi:MAG: response regulator transcription factor [Magnetococcales bacterium]|nr:response regulator transcription factor [Magnetococcales bacterium]